jgi:hypothetical protein
VLHLYEAWDKQEQASAWKLKLGVPYLTGELFAKP